MKEDRLPFGKKLSEVEAEQANAPAPEATEEVKNEPVIENAGKTAEPPKKEETKTEAPKQATWLEEVNKLYKTEFKAPEEFSKHLEKAKKADEYEPKFSEFENNEKKYKQQLQELQSSLKEIQNPLSYFSSQEAFVAEQLRKQHPDKSPYVLQEIVTRDNKTMDDVDVLIKNQMLETPDLIGGENGAREYILDKYGIDPDTPNTEWTTTVRNKIKIEANAARKVWEELKKTVQVPNIATPEQKEAERVRAKEELRTKIVPLKETFSKFDKFTEEIEDGKIFDFNVPDEYKEDLGQMFETYIVDAGVEPTAENLANIEELKKALLLSKYFKQIYKTIEGDVETRMKAERDKLLGNENPSNTHSATEIEETDEIKKFNKEHGMGKLLGKK